VLFPKFTDPLEVNSLEIVYVNTDKATSGGSDISRFKVARNQGQWVITSHKNYPADAENQIRDAATALIGVESIQILHDMLQVIAGFLHAGVTPVVEALNVGLAIALLPQGAVTGGAAGEEQQRADRHG
jgi:hypothetical protein